MDFVYAVLSIAALTALCFSVWMLYSAFKIVSKNALDSQEQTQHFATGALELLKAQTLAEKASIDVQREASAVPLEEQEPATAPLNVKTVDGRIVDLAGNEWELL